MKRAVLWLLAIALAAALTVLVFLPATWLGSMVETETGGRLTLGDAQGTLWRGSAFVGGAAGANGAVTPLLPGRFSWQVSPLLLLGQVELTLENPEALSQPVNLSGSLSPRAWSSCPGARCSWRARGRRSMSRAAPCCRWRTWDRAWRPSSRSGPTR
jgi:general secretion pathway protein N